jgi:hypothetical protein
MYEYDPIWGIFQHGAMSKNSRSTVEFEHETRGDPYCVSEVGTYIDASINLVLKERARADKFTQSAQA